MEESGAERKRSKLGMAGAIFKRREISGGREENLAVIKRTGWGGPGIAGASIVKEEKGR